MALPSTTYVDYRVSLAWVGTVLRYIGFTPLFPLVLAVYYGEDPLPFAAATAVMVLAGTLLDRVKTPLTNWMVAAWLVSAAKNGLSATTLERTLGVSYHTAWAILQRFRVAMVRAERTRLSGTVEVDETFVGGVSRGGKSGRGSASKTVVVVAVEILSPKGFGRCRLRVSPSAAQHDLTPIVCDLVEPGSVLLTDAWQGYDRA